ncbi:hypothetical protein HOY82DRAFT_188265 [Tuber indicum]|nr:hypothetical protein HOY82DRAFT_188265 [Tuber indicum]
MDRRYICIVCHFLFLLSLLNPRLSLSLYTIFLIRTPSKLPPSYQSLTLFISFHLLGTRLGSGFLTIIFVALSPTFRFIIYHSIISLSFTNNIKSLHVQLCFFIFYFLGGW